jgi:hypothetical protein
MTEPMRLAIEAVEAVSRAGLHHLNKPAPPSPAPPPSIIACACGRWIVEPRYTYPTAAALVPMPEGSFRRFVNRRRRELPEPVYSRIGHQVVRFITASEIIAVRRLRDTPRPAYPRVRLRNGT